MIEATLDVNVIVPGFAAPRSTPAVLVERWIGREFHVTLPEHIVVKAAEVWGRRYWADRYDANQIDRAVALLRQRAAIVVPDPTVRGVAVDEEDDLVLATAVAGRVDVPVTGDHGLLALESFRGIAILSPGAFLDWLDVRLPGGR